MKEEQPESQPKRRRRYYDEEFKRNAVELLERGERSAIQLSRELGISDCSLGKWKLLPRFTSTKHEHEDDRYQPATLQLLALAEPSGTL